jgi:hypothetical protein
MKSAARLPVKGMEYEVPEQDLSNKLRKMRAIPGSRFVMSSVKVR